MTMEVHYSDLDRRLRYVELQVTTLDRRNSELREEVIKARHEIEFIKDMVTAHALKVDAILGQVHAITGLQNGLERQITSLFESLESKLISIKASVEAAGVGLPTPI